MNKDKLRVAIAVACGWRRKPEFDYTRLMRGTVDAEERVEMWGTDQGQLIPFDALPGYPNDLNAMHEAEKTLLFSQRQEYYLHLQDIISRPLRQNERVALHECIRATAAQRAEAFARVMGVWEDGL